MKVNSSMVVDLSKIKKILFIRYSAFGDIAATFPIIRQVRDRFPNAKIDYLISTGYKAIASIIPFVDEVIEFKVPANLRGFFNSIKFIGETLKQGFQLRQRQYDLVIDLQSNNRSLVLRVLASAKISASCNHHQYQQLSVERYSSAITNIGFPAINSVNCPIGYPISTQINSDVSKYLVSNCVTSPYLCLAPAGLWETKLWPINYYADLAKQYNKTYNEPVLVIGDKKERYRAEEIKKLAGEFVQIVSGDTSLPVSVGLLHKARGFVGNDSGLAHFAWTAGIPTITICGPTNPQWIGPAGNVSIGIARSELDCIYCHYYKCKRGDHACMNLLTPDFIYEKLYELINRREQLKTLADKS